MERNIRTFDLSSPIQAFQFATFLLRVRAQSEKLKVLFEEKKLEFVEKVKRYELQEWTKKAQMKCQVTPPTAQTEEREARAIDEGVEK